MAQCRQEFALVGYSENLESRPLRFVDPIPASRICSACGNIPRLTYTPVCGHTFCEACYQSCATTSECVCPLDGDVCGRDDVSRKEYPAEQLLRREVHCWNEATGCRVVLPASQIAEHARRDCQHHVSRCPTCSADVLSRDVCAHLKSRCTTLVLHTAPEAPRETKIEGNFLFVELERQVDQRMRDLEASFEQLSLGSGSNNVKLATAFNNINYLKEAQGQMFQALAEKFERASVATIDRLVRNEEVIRALAAREEILEERVAQLFLQYASQSDKLVDVFLDINNLMKSLTKTSGAARDGAMAVKAAINNFDPEKDESVITIRGSLLRSFLRNVGSDNWVLEDYASLKQSAEEFGVVSRMTEKLYLRQYHMSWGIAFLKEDGRFYIALCIQLGYGREDQSLDWPFQKPLILSIIHPETQQVLHRAGIPPFPGTSESGFHKPIFGPNPSVRFPDSKLDSEEIERGGFVKENKLILRLDVVS